MDERQQQPDECRLNERKQPDECKLNERKQPNKHKLNSLLISRLKPKASPYLVWDTRSPGLAIQVQQHDQQAYCWP